MIERRFFFKLAGMAGALMGIGGASAAEPEKHLRVYAYKGEISTCDKGHPLAIFTRDVHVMERASADQFAFVGDARMSMTACPICDGRVMAGLGLYFIDGIPRGIDD